MSNLLFVVSSKPYESGHTDEAHDLIMASTAYGHEAAVLFKEDGVFQLETEQAPPVGQKNAAKRIQGFEFFDIEPIYGCKSSLDAVSLTTSDVITGVEWINTQKVEQLIQDADYVINL